MALNVQINTTANTAGLNAAQKAVQKAMSGIQSAAQSTSKKLGSMPKGAAFRSQAMQEQIQSATDIARLGTGGAFQAFTATPGQRGGLSSAQLATGFGLGPTAFTALAAQGRPEAEGVARTISKTLGRVQAGQIISPREINATIGQLQVLDELLGRDLPLSAEETKKQLQVVNTELKTIGSRIGGAKTAVQNAAAAGKATGTLTQRYNDLRSRQQFLISEQSKLSASLRDVTLAMTSASPTMNTLTGNLEAMGTASQTTHSRLRVMFESMFPWVGRLKAVTNGLNLTGGAMQGVLLGTSAMEGNLMGVAFSLIFLRFAMLPAAAAGLALSIAFTQISKAAKTTRDTAKEVGNLTRTLMSSGQTYTSATLLSTDLYKTYQRNIDAIKVLAGPTASRLEDRMKLLSEASIILARNGLEPTNEIMDSIIATSLGTGKSMADVAQGMVDLVKPGKFTVGSLEDFRSNLDKLIPMWYKLDGALMSPTEKLQKQIGVFSTFIGEMDASKRAMLASDLMILQFGETLAGLETKDPRKQIELLSKGAIDLQGFISKVDEEFTRTRISANPLAVLTGKLLEGSVGAEIALAKNREETIGQLAKIIQMNLGLLPPASFRDKVNEFFGEINDNTKSIVKEMGYLTPEEFLKMAEAEYEGVDASQALLDRLNGINTIDFSSYGTKLAPITNAFASVNTTLDATIAKLDEIYTKTPTKTAGEYFAETGQLPSGGGAILGPSLPGPFVLPPLQMMQPEYYPGYDITVNVNGPVMSGVDAETAAAIGASRAMALALTTSRTAAD